MIDNNEFKDLGNFWDDDSSSWGTEDLNDLHRLLDDEGEQPFPDEQAVESRSARLQGGRQVWWSRLPPATSPPAWRTPLCS